MNIRVAGNAEDTDWSGTVSRFSGAKRRKVLDRAARLVIDPEANANEKDMSAHQLQAALAVDPELVFKVMAEIQTNGISDVEIDRLKHEAAEANARFEALVDSLRAFRVALTDLGGVKRGDRLPETVEAWKAVAFEIAARALRQVEAQRHHLAQRRDELERRRTEVLAEIDAAQTRLNRKAGDKTPLLAQIAQANHAIGRLSFDYDHIDAFEIAKLITGKGIYIGEYEPADLEGQRLGFKLSAFVSPKPLREVTGRPLTFNDTATAIGQLKGWQGHDGCQLDPARYYAELCERLRHDPASVLGKWVIAPLELVRGRDRDGKMVRAGENMYDLKDAGDFAKARPFVTTSGSGLARWLWSCTPGRADPDAVRAVHCTDGNDHCTDGCDHWILRSNYEVSCVPARLERLAL